MPSSDSTFTYTSISSEDVPFWGICFFGMEQLDSPEASHSLLFRHHQYHMMRMSDPEEYEDDETEDGPVDYPMDGGEDGDDDNDESSRDDPDDEDEDEEDGDEEHLVLAESAIVIPTDELVSPPKGNEPVIPPPTTDTTTTGAKINTLRLASTQVLIDVVTAAIPSSPPPPPLYISPPIDRRDDIPEIEMPPRKRCGIRDSWVDPAETVPEIAPMTIGEVNIRVTKLAELHEHDTQDIYALLEDAQDTRTRISQRVTIDSQRVDLLMKDRIAHQETILIVEEEAYAAREAWAHSIGLSQAVHYELQTYWEQMQHTEIAELRETDRRRQAQMPRRARQPGGDARVPDHQDAPRDADSHI
nr:hypothetical protein [Tanacetum cinerariifolium]